jgi:hypothetical protein
LRNFRELVGLEFVGIYKYGVWIKFVYCNQQKGVVGKTILDLIRPKPLLFEFSIVSFLDFENHKT